MNIGGQRFTTYKTTLLNAKGSYFEAMLSSGKWLPDEDNEYFIDRDPTHFGMILNYLRTGEWDVTRISDYDKEKIDRELQYYQINVNPVNPSSQPDTKQTVVGWVFDSNKKHSGIILNDNKKVAKTNISDRHRSVLGTIGFKDGKHVWKAKLVGTDPHWHGAGICKANDAKGTGYGEDFRHYLGFGSGGQLYKMKGSHTNNEVGDIYTFTLDMNNLTFTIIGPNTNLIATVEKGVEYFPIFNICKPSNSWELLE